MAIPKKRVIVLAVLVSVLLTGCFLIPRGEISGHSFTEGYSVEMAALIPIFAILEIDPAVDGQSIVVTDEDGYFKLYNVPVGTYVISPLHVPAEWAVTVTVASGEESTVTIPTPSVAVNTLVFNTSLTDPPFDSATVRRALSAAIDRDALCTALDTDPSTVLFPAGFDLSGFSADLENAPNNDLAGANSDLAGVSEFAFELLYSDVAAVVDYVTQLKPYFEALDKVTEVTGTALPRSDYINLWMGGDYDLSKLGWGLDSNNLAQYLAIWRTEGYGSYSNSAFDAILDEAHAAITSGDVATYEAKLVEAHNILIQGMIAIPVYCQ